MNEEDEWRIIVKSKQQVSEISEKNLPLSFSIFKKLFVASQRTLNLISKSLLSILE